MSEEKAPSLKGITFEGQPMDVYLDTQTQKKRTKQIHQLRKADSFVPGLHGGKKAFVPNPWLAPKSHKKKGKEEFEMNSEVRFATKREVREMNRKLELKQAGSLTEQILIFVSDGNTHSAKTIYEELGGALKDAGVKNVKLNKSTVATIFMKLRHELNPLCEFIKESKETEQGRRHRRGSMYIQWLGGDTTGKELITLFNEGDRLIKSKYKGKKVKPVKTPAKVEAAPVSVQAEEPEEQNFTQTAETANGQHVQEVTTKGKMYWSLLEAVLKGAEEDGVKIRVIIENNPNTDK